MSSQGLLSARAHPCFVEYESSLFDGENNLFDFEAPIDFGTNEITGYLFKRSLQTSFQVPM